MLHNFYIESKATLQSKEMKNFHGYGASIARRFTNDNTTI